MAMSIYEKMKAEAKQKSSNKSLKFWCPDGQKKKVRFIQDIDKPYEIMVHYDYQLNINRTCTEQLGESCADCSAGIPFRSVYAWTVWNHDENKRQLLAYHSSKCTPISALIALHDTLGSLLVRDVTLSCNGKGKDAEFNVVSHDPEQLPPNTPRNELVPFSFEQAVKIYKDAEFKQVTTGEPQKTYSSNPLNNVTNTQHGWNNAPQGIPEPDKYAGKTDFELYTILTQERKIDVPTRQTIEFYKQKLVEDDNSKNTWGATEPANDPFPNIDIDPWNNTVPNSNPWDNMKQNEPIAETVEDKYGHLNEFELWTHLTEKLKLNVPPRKDKQFYLGEIEKYEAMVNSTEANDEGLPWNTPEEKTNDPWAGVN